MNLKLIILLILIIILIVAIAVLTGNNLGFEFIGGNAVNAPPANPGGGIT
jgi:preprotein translocase subunit SecF